MHVLTQQCSNSCLTDFALSKWDILHIKDLKLYSTSQNKSLCQHPLQHLNDQCIVMMLFLLTWHLGVLLITKLILFSPLLTTSRETYSWKLYLREMIPYTRLRNNFNCCSYQPNTVLLYRQNKKPSLTDILRNISLFSFQMVFDLIYSF